MLETIKTWKETVLKIRLRSSYEPVVVAHECNSNSDKSAAKKKTQLLHRKLLLSIPKINLKVPDREVLDTSMSRKCKMERHYTGPTGPTKPTRWTQTDPFSFGPKCPEMLVQWIAPCVYRRYVYYSSSSSLYLFVEAGYLKAL